MVGGPTRYAYQVFDTDDNAGGGDADTILFDIAITARADNLVPTFGDATIGAQRYIVGIPLVPLTLPVASGGDGTLTYSLRTSGRNPMVITDLSTVIPGLTFNDAARTITGTPTTAASPINYTWNAEDMDSDLATLLFGVTVVENASPDFADGASILAQDYSVGETVLLSLPPATDGGNGNTVYTLTPALPAGLTFNADARPNPTITGVPTTETAATQYTYRVDDSDNSPAGTDGASLIFTVTVTGAMVDTAPTFGGATIPDGAFVQNRAIMPITLPAATGGNGGITYTLTGLPAGLSFNPATRVVSGAPQAIATSATVSTYTAADRDMNTAADDTATLTFTITSVTQAPPTGIRPCRSHRRKSRNPRRPRLSQSRPP